MRPVACLRAYRTRAGSRVAWAFHPLRSRVLCLSMRGSSWSAGFCWARQVSGLSDRSLRTVAAATLSGVDRLSVPVISSLTPEQGDPS